MSIKIFDTPEVQGFLKTVSGLDGNEGDPRAKQIIHRIVSDLFKAIDDLDITPDEYWTAVGWLNELGTAGQAGLISPGLRSAGRRVGKECVRTCRSRWSRDH